MIVKRSPAFTRGGDFIYEVSIKDFTLSFSFLRLYALLLLCAWVGFNFIGPREIARILTTPRFLFVIFFFLES